MKELTELNFSERVRYTDDHEWAEIRNDVIRIGISDYAQDQLGDIVFVELPEVGSRFDFRDPFGTVESVKAVSELYMPIAGEIVAINTALEDNPDLVNNQPYDDGWMIEVRPAAVDEFEKLKTRDQYVDMLKG